MPNSLTLFLNNALVPMSWLVPEHLSVQTLQTCVLGRALMGAPTSSKIDTNSSSANSFETAIAAEHALAPESLAGIGFANSNLANGAWLIQPAHFQLAMDHLLLAPLHQVELSAQHSTALIDALVPVMSSYESTLQMLSASHWAWQATAPWQLKSFNSNLAEQRDIASYLPKGPDARRWRAMSNEVQMTWFNHPVNIERENAGLPVINGWWLNGQIQTPTQFPYQVYIGKNELARDLAFATKAEYFSTLGDYLNNAKSATDSLSMRKKNIAWIDSRLPPSHYGDPREWLQQLRSFDDEIEFLDHAKSLTWRVKAFSPTAMRDFEMTQRSSLRNTLTSLDRTLRQLFGNRANINSAFAE